MKTQMFTSHFVSETSGLCLISSSLSLQHIWFSSLICRLLHVDDVVLLFRSVPPGDTDDEGSTEQNMAAGSPIPKIITTAIIEDLSREEEDERDVWGERLGQGMMTCWGGGGGGGPPGSEHRILNVLFRRFHVLSR